MADTWQTELWTTLATIASAHEDATPAQQQQMTRQLRPTLARISANYHPAKNGDPDLRYLILDDCRDIADILTAILGPDWTPTPGSLGAKLQAAGVKIA